MSKNLYVFTRDNGDGSTSTQYTMNEDWIVKMETLNENGELDLDSGWIDGDGFHYDVLTVPDECTLESLGIHRDCAVAFLLC